MRPYHHRLFFLLQFTVLAALPFRRTPVNTGKFARVTTPALLLTLPRFCRSPTCVEKSLSLLENCHNVHHIHSLHTIRANCPSSILPQLLETPRFGSIQLTKPLNLQSTRKRAFLNITRLSFHQNVATMPSGHAIPLTAHRIRRCAKSRGEGVFVYVIDTGCRTTHEQLRGRVTKRPAPGSKFRSGEDDHGHGTHVATTIAGRDFGLAPRAKVVCIKALTENNDGSGTDVISGINYVTRIHPRGQPGIISISLGVRAEKRYTALDQAIGRAASMGIVSVVAAGNSGRDACTFTPARATSAITVAAVGRDGLLAEFSNWGNCVVVGAPGVRVWSAVAAGDRMYGISSGTSMAAPFVTGLVALRLSKGSVADVADLRDWLRRISREKMGMRVVSTARFCRWMKQS